MIKYLPNILTLLRVILVPIFIYFMFYFKPINAGAIFGTTVFIIASITDYYDGMLARKYKIVSNFGKIMDPLADKILVASALFALAIEPINYISFWVVSIILFREIVVTLMRDYYAKKQIYIAANIWGKLKTTFQLTGIIAALVYYNLYLNFPQIEFLNQRIIFGIVIFFWIVAAITILSGINYFVMKKEK